MFTERQTAIIRFAREHGGKITRKEALKEPSIVAGIYPHPDAQARYVDQSIHRLVKRGVLTREKPGHFALCQTPTDPEQPTLL